MVLPRSYVAFFDHGRSLDRSSSLLTLALVLEELIELYNAVDRCLIYSRLVLNELNHLLRT